MPKLFLIGKTGQLGGAMLEEAGRRGLETAAYAHGDLEITDEVALRKEVEYTRPEVIINTAAFHLVPACEENPAEALRVNCIAVRNLAKIAKKHGSKFITFSTDYVFDGEKGAPYLEDDPPRPIQFYGVSKLCGEYAALNVFPEGTYVIRTSGLFGGRKGSGSKPGGNLVLQMLHESKSKAAVEISKEQIVSPTFAGDLARSTLELLQKKAESGIYHLVNEGYCTWADFVSHIFAVKNIKTKVIPVGRGGMHEGVRRPKFSALKNTKAAALGITFPSWQEGLDFYLNFLTKVKPW